MRYRVCEVFTIFKSFVCNLLYTLFLPKAKHTDDARMSVLHHPVVKTLYCYLVCHPSKPVAKWEGESGAKLLPGKTFQSLKIRHNHCLNALKYVSLPIKIFLLWEAFSPRLVPCLHLRQKVHEFTPLLRSSHYSLCTLDQPEWLILDILSTFMPITVHSCTWNSKLHFALNPKCVGVLRKCLEYKSLKLLLLVE